MEILPLITVPVLYFAVALLKPYVQAKLPFNLCAMCVAVSLTWLVLLLLWLVGEEVSLVLIAILMGMSIAGAMYKMEAFYKKTKTRNFWFVRLALILGGLYAVFFLLQENWNLLSLILIGSFLLIAIASLLFQGTTHKDVLQENQKAGKKSSIIKKLEDCC